jgi:hypothetical protein
MSSLWGIYTGNWKTSFIYNAFSLKYFSFYNTYVIVFMRLVKRRDRSEGHVRSPMPCPYIDMLDTWPTKSHSKQDKLESWESPHIYFDFSLKANQSCIDYPSCTRTIRTSFRRLYHCWELQAGDVSLLDQTSASWTTCACQVPCRKNIIKRQVSPHFPLHKQCLPFWLWN